MFESVKSMLTRRVLSREEGQGMVEYGLIIALVAVVAIAGLIILGPAIAAMFTGLGTSI